MKPHTTVALEAPYKIGAVMDMCSSVVGEGRFQHKELGLGPSATSEIINANAPP